MSDYVVTGIPRSGTSLILSLLNSDENMMCFSEPPWIKLIRNNADNGDQLSQLLRHKISELRRDILESHSIEMVYQKNKNTPPDNYFKREVGGIKKTRNTEWVTFDSSKANNHFVIKANAVFTAVLPSLIKAGMWQIVPVIRDPLYVLMSWNSVPIASSKGRVAVVEKFSNDLKLIAQQKPLLKRQVLLLDWYFKQYEIFESDDVLYYENLISNPLVEIKKFFPEAEIHLSKLKSKNTKSRYANETEQIYKDALLQYGQELKKYYPQYA